MTDKPISGLTAAGVAAGTDVFPVVQTTGVGPLKQTLTALKTFMSNSPTLVTPALGTPASGVATNLTGTAAGLTAGNVTTNANLTGVITSSGNATSINSQTGTGSKFVVDTSPTLVTPVLGVATATSVNKVTITAPTTSAVLTLTDGKTLAVTNTLTLSGTDGTTMTFPGTSTTVAGLGIAQTFSAVQTFSGGEINSTNATASTPSLLLNGTAFSGGTGTTTWPQFLIQPNGTTATNWSTSGTGIGVNMGSGYTGLLVSFQINGVVKFSVDQFGSITNTGSASFAASGNVTFSGRGIITSTGAGDIHHGATDAAAPVAQTITMQSVIAGTTNTAGQNATIKGSLSTGSGTSGDIIFQTGGTGAAATVVNTATTALTIKGATQAVVVASGKALQLGNAATTGLSAGVLSATTNASIVLTDSTGQAYRIPCII